ncbi:CIC11C00000001770 [Sungouiella intermedia]|uniref:CIC11C00000001770 n=1 Tax=Sungouiella intermedia TaxID=45354 RepID=A0A1L0DQ73_9ASCO|nr:CIC11C00000001770 [[Candida] intermedia]
MLLSRSVALSILATLGVNALVLPNVGDIIDVFLGSELAELKDSIVESSKKLGQQVVSTVADYEAKFANSKALAPLMDNDRQAIAHKYIVVFKTGLAPDATQFHREWVAAKHAEDVKSTDASDDYFASIKDANVEGGISDIFDIADFLSGYSGYFLDLTIDWIRRDPSVAFVEKDSMVYANEFDVQKGAPWGLARISHRAPLSLGSFNQYLYDSEGGEGVTSYVIDTGVFVDHVQFEGRALWGATIPSGDSDTDGNGHGTHCAGTIASKDYGVAKKANVVAVKVLRSNGSGSMSDVVKGVEYAAKSHQAAAKAGKKGFKGSTANMSLGGGKSPALDLAVNAAVKAGIHFAVAAGNENQDAANTSPASAELAITVGASTISDARAYFSNYGSTVDIFAPGLNIVSTYIGSETATATLSGTSMASPHIAGLLSYFVSLQPGAKSEFFVSDKGVSTTQLKKNLVNYASKNKLTDIPEDGTPNILAFNGAGHNLTDFWSGTVYEESAKAVSDNEFSILGDKFEAMYEKVGKDSKELLDEVKELVNGIYSRD